MSIAAEIQTFGVKSVRGGGYQITNTFVTL